MQVSLEKHNTTRTIFSVEITENSERHTFYPIISVINHGLTKVYELGQEFFESTDYRNFADFGETITSIVTEGARVVKNEKFESVTNLVDALDWLQKEALRGHSRQRYKGLGEMNPDQLWKTTMDPVKRTMLRVTIEDAIAADQVFNTLMGDQVEPRREFIEQNALAVANLDI